MTDRPLKTHLSDPYFVVAVLISLGFSILFSYYSIMRYLVQDATGFDLGIYSSALYSAMHGTLFHTNLLNGSFLGNHFSPFMFLLLAVFSVYPHNTTLLVIQAFAIGFAGVPAYMIYEMLDRSKSHRQLGLLLMILFEFAVILIGPISFDFHLMALFPLFYLFTFYFLMRGNKILSLVFLALSISLHAFFSVIMVLLLISIYLQKLWNDHHKVESQTSIVTLPFLFISSILIIIYLIIAEHIKGIISGQSIDLVSLHSLMIYLKERYNITFSLGALDQYVYVKLLMVALMLVGGGVFAFRYPILILPIIPYFLFAFFSGNAAYFIAGYQYTAMFAPVLVAGAAFSISKMASSGILSNQKIKKGIVVSLIIMLIAVNFLLGPISPIFSQNSFGNIESIYSFNYNETSIAVFSLRAYLNHSSSILLQNNIYPPYFQFRNAYLLYSYNLVGNLGTLLKANFTYIIGDMCNPFYEQTAAVGISMQSLIQYELHNGYGLLFDQYGIIAIERGYKGPVLHLQDNRLVE